MIDGPGVGLTRKSHANLIRLAEIGCVTSEAVRQVLLQCFVNDVLALLVIVSGEEQEESWSPVMIGRSDVVITQDLGAPAEQRSGIGELRKEGIQNRLRRFPIKELAQFQARDKIFHHDQKGNVISDYNLRNLWIKD